MNRKIELFPAKNPNPVLRVEKDGTVLYTNKAGEPLLHEWSTIIGDKLPSNIVDIVNKVISQNSPEKIEVRAGKSVYSVAFHPLHEEECVNIYGFDISDQKELEEKLRESEEKYRNIVETSNEGIYFVNNEGKVTFANKMMETSGYSLEEIIGKPVWNFIPEESLLVAKKEFEKRRKGISGSYELKLIRKNGSVIWTYITAKPFFNKKGKFDGYLAMMTDITERKETEEKLRESEEKYRNIVETANEGIYLVNSENKVTYANQKIADISGYKLEEVVGKSVLDFVSEESKPIAKEHLVERRIGISKSYELKLLCKNGTSLWASINSKPFFNKDGKFTGYLGMLIDITERKVAEEKLRESEEKYRNIVEIANEGILVIDSELKISFYNQKLMDMLGYSFVEGIGRPIWDYIKEESKSSVIQSMEKRRKGINESYELELIRKDGSSLWVLLNAKSLFDKDGKFMGSISLITDISERKKAEEALANIEVARQKEIHHRIKNNLQVISSLLDLQAEKFRGNECVNDSEILEAFRESQDRVISMALIHEELYKGGEFETLNFSQYIKDLAHNLFQTYSIRGSDICLKLDLEVDALFNMDVAVPLGMIVNELVTNSFKHAFDGKKSGEIRIGLHRAENEQSIKSINKDYSTKFILTVSDNGVGIPELDIKDLDSLGMQLVTSLVDQLDGKLELKKGNGTEFIIQFTVTDKSITHPSKPYN